MFVDEATIYVSSGAGGNGSSSFHHEPYKPRGGPDGGDGGDGGSVILRADMSAATLLRAWRTRRGQEAPWGTRSLSRRGGAYGNRGDG